MSFEQVEETCQRTDQVLLKVGQTHSSRKLDIFKRAKYLLFFKYKRANNSTLHENAKIAICMVIS